MAVGEREQTEKIQNNTTMFSKLFVFCIVRPQINTSYARPPLFAIAMQHLFVFPIHVKM